MNKNSLKATNPHLQDPDNYRQALIANVASSTAIETGSSVEEVAQLLLHARKGHSVRQTTDFAQ